MAGAAHQLRRSSQRESLPIASYRDELLRMVQAHQVLVCIGETGSGALGLLAGSAAGAGLTCPRSYAGKSTQLPQFLHEAGFSARGAIGVTQPRRVAAVSVAKRVAEELISAPAAALPRLAAALPHCVALP